MSPRAFGDMLERAALAWRRDQATSMAAAVAFYTLFSLGPLLVLVIAIAGLVVGEGTARDQMLGQVAQLVGPAGARSVGAILDAAGTRQTSLVATLTGAVTLVIGVTTVFAELRDDLDRVWNYRAARASGVLALVRARFLSFGLVVAIGFLLVVSLAVSAVLSYLGRMLGGGEELMQGLDFLSSLAVLTVLFALIFKILPSPHVGWEDVWAGSAVTALLFSLGKFAIGLWLGRSVVASWYGAAGTVVLLVLWVYYSSLIFFYGAEFTHEYAMRHGSRRHPPQAANSEFPREADALVARAWRIVKGRDPLVQKPTG